MIKGGLAHNRPKLYQYRNGRKLCGAPSTVSTIPSQSLTSVVASRLLTASVTDAFKMYAIPRFFIRNFRCRWLNKTWVWLDDLAGHGKFDKKANDFWLAKC